MDSPLFRFIIFSCLLALYQQAQADKGILLHSDQENTTSIAEGSLDHSILLGSYFEILEDPSGLLTLADILNSPESYFFTTAKSAVSQLGDRKSTFWLKLTYKLPTLETPWAITIDYPHLKNIEVYTASENEYNKLLTTGYGQLPFKYGPSVQGFGFYLPDDKSEQTLYLRISSDSPLIVPAYLHTLETVLAHEKLNNQLRGLFYGIFFVMAAFNLFIFFTTRNESYIFYALYIGAIFIFTLSNDGVIRESLFAGSPRLMSYGTHMLTAIAPLIFGALFCQHILYTKEKLPIFHHLFNGVIVVSIAVASIILIFGALAVPRAVMVLTLGFAFIAISAGIAGLIKNIPTARFFCIAWAAVILGSSTWILTLLDVLPFNQFSQFSLHMGAVCETILLSMALGDRIRVLEKERLALEQQAKEQLKESNRQLEASNRFKDEFLSVISHELRTPMNGIFGATELLRFTHPNDEQQGYIDTVTNSSKDMLKMVEDILTYTQCEAGTLSVTKSAFNLKTMLTPLVAEYQKRCIAKDVLFKVDIDEHLPESIYADKSKLRLILQHLLDNAWKFTDKGEVKFICKIKDNNRDRMLLQFQVIDTGCGVPENLQNSIFESFRQADGSLTRKKGGLGIGLALCKRIADIIEGDFQFHSEERQGCSVTLTLAVENQAAVGGSIHHQRKAAFPKLKPGKKILIVEDNPVNKLVLEALIKKLGLMPCTAINGKEAVDFLDNNQVDLILMDCQMPVMDGFEATQVIRQKDNNSKQIPIIAVTANANPGDRLKCLEAGMNDYIKKPISQNILIDKLSNWLAD
ncbi:MAG: response regulator [Pseudomonadales bacterium]|nr:response regulator [Pseudomonadales bacterium]